MTSPKKVLFVSHTPNLYGAERSLLALVIELKSRNKVAPIVLLPSTGPLENELKKHNITVHIFGKYRWWVSRNWIRKLLFSVIRITWTYLAARLFIIKHPEVHSMLIYSNTLVCPMGYFISKLTNRPHIFHAREIVKEGIGHTYDIGEKQAMKLIGQSQSIICNSQAVSKELLKHLSKEKIKVIYNGFNFSASDYLSAPTKLSTFFNEKKATKLIIVGTVSHEKGQHIAIKCIHKLVSNGINATLEIVGSGTPEYINQLISVSKTLGISNRIHWAGQVKNTKSYFQKAFITLICSKAEAFGRVAVESISYGTPVIGTNSGGINEIIKHNETGLLYEYGDIHALMTQIELLTKNPSLYKKLSEKGMNYISNTFTLNKHVIEIENEIASSMV